MSLSLLIPARNELFLRRTVEDALSHIEGDTEIIAVLDGEWADPPLPQHERLTVLYNPVPLGQRAACNQAARLAQGKYVAKFDAHCAFDQGFDLKLLRAFAEAGDDATIVPVMYNLHAFDWVCPDGHRRYQSPSGPCQQCGKPTERDVVWRRRRSRKSVSYRFDAEPHFQYFPEYTERPGWGGDLTETMSLQGSGFALTRERYFSLGVCDESWGSWGSQGIEVACKTWLSGGRVLVSHRTWYAHLFRTQGGDFGFPYEHGNSVKDHKKKARDLFFGNQWPKQVRPLSWLVEKFWPVPGWTEADLRALKERENLR